MSSYIAEAAFGLLCGVIIFALIIAGLYAVYCVGEWICKKLSNIWDDDQSDPKPRGPLGFA